MKTFSIKELTELLQGKSIGNSDISITGAENLQSAKEGDISFIGNTKYQKLWTDSQASAAIISSKIQLEPSKNQAFIVVDNVDLAMAKVLELLAPELPVLEGEVHPNAFVDTTATIGENTQIGFGSYVGKNVKIGKNTKIYPNVTILDNTIIGDNCLIWSGTIIRERSIIGNHCIFHNNCSIGADGFGYRPAENGQGLVKIPHIGNVIIGDFVEIGANSCVDRGKFSATKLGMGCKIDNLVQIAHNCELGMFCIMAGSSGLAGSVTLGNGVLIGGSASIKDHTKIGDGAVVAAGSGVMNDIPAGGKVLGYPAYESRETLKQWVALRQLAKK